MPRKNSMIWKYFLKTRKMNSPYIHGKCVYCEETYVSNASRMQKHLIKCNMCPANIKSIFSDSKSSKAEETDETLSEASSSFNVHSPVNIESYIDKMTKSTKDKLDSMMARAIYASSTPLNIVESKYWKEFLNSLRPAYSAPSRYQLSNSLLEKEYNLIQNIIKRKICNADSVSIMSDGWTDINGTSLINIIVTTPEPVFFKCIDSHTESHTGEYIAKILSETIEEIGVEKVNGLVTDNAANMKAAWNILNKKYPNLITYGCHAHGLNLLIKDIVSIPLIAKKLAQAKQIIRFYKNKHLPMQMLKKVQLENGGKVMALHTSCDTRWGSNSRMLKSLIACKDDLQAATVTKDVSKIIDSGIRRNILDIEKFWPLVQNISDLIKIPSEIITKIEGDSPGLSYMHQNMIDIDESITNSSKFLSVKDKETVSFAIDNRKSFMFHKVQLAAHFLNPKLKSKQLSEENEQNAIEYILNQAKKLNLDWEKVLVDIGEYNANASLWSRDTIWDAANHMDPLTWWKGLCGKRELSKVAIIVLNLPASAAACERNWSTFGNIKTKKRNRLTIERTNKLVSIQFNLKLLDTSKLEENKENETHISDSDDEIEDANSDNFEWEEIQDIDSDIGVNYNDEQSQEMETNENICDEDETDTIMCKNKMLAENEEEHNANECSLSETVLSSTAPILLYDAANCRFMPIKK